MRTKLHFVLRSLLVMICLAAAPATVLARLPNTSTPGCVRLVAGNGTEPAQAFGQFEVIVRDLTNNPLPGALVEVDFSSVPELFLARVQMDPDMSLDCTARKVSKLTDANGRAVFCILGAGSAASPPVTLVGWGKIYANGTYIGNPTVTAFDLDGTLGLGAGDLSQFLQDFASGNPYGRSDFDCSSQLGAGDLSMWLKAFASGTQVVSAVTCP